MSTPARRAFLDAAAQAAALLARPEVAAAWDEPSALPEMTVGALAGHLLRGMATVQIYMDGEAPEPGAEPITAAAYFNKIDLGTDIYNERNTDIRARSVEMAAGGPAAVAAQAQAARDALTKRLTDEPDDRMVKVIGGNVLTLDEYLATRIIELLTHADDLAVSLGIEQLPPSPAAATVAFQALLEVARLRHGDTAVLRALTRRERDEVGALRIF